MNVITVNSAVREYHDEVKPYNTLNIRNHWNDNNKVVLNINGEKDYVFYAEHLKKAIDNAQNAH